MTSTIRPYARRAAASAVKARVIALRDMAKIDIDHAARTAWVETGATASSPEFNSG